MSVVGIVIALAEELCTLVPKKLKQGEIAHLGENIWVIYSGAGAENANNAAQSLVKKGATALISWGCAAALKSDLKPSALVLAKHCISADKTEINVDQHWLENALDILQKQSPLLGAIAESADVVSSGSEKLKLGVVTDAVALDMESAAIGRIAQEHGLPFLVIRAIADPQTMDLPKAVNYSLNAKGQVDMAKLLGYLVKHPDEIFGLIRLGLHFNAAKRTLKQVAASIDKIAYLPNKTA